MGEERGRGAWLVFGFGLALGFVAGMLTLLVLVRPVRAVGAESSVFRAESSGGSADFETNSDELRAGADGWAPLPPGLSGGLMAPSVMEEALVGLTDGEARAVMVMAGWPAGLVDEAVEVARCESHLVPGNSNGEYRGLFGLWWPGWFDYAGEEPGRWFDAVVNARVALAVFRYDVERGRPGWAQWDEVCRR